MNFPRYNLVLLSSKCYLSMCPGTCIVYYWYICNFCRVKYYSQLSISLCYILVTISYVRPRALSFCDSCFRQESLLRRSLHLSCDLCIQASERGQSVSMHLLPCPLCCISWSIVVLLDFLALVYFNMYSCYVMVILVLVFSVP